jgi:hypothetical protein
VHYSGLVTAFMLKSIVICQSFSTHYMPVYKPVPLLVAYCRKDSADNLVYCDRLGTFVVSKS